MTDAAVVTPDPGLLARVVGILTAPRATYEKVVANPRPFGILFLVAIVIALAAGLPQMTEAGRQASLDMQVRQTERFSGQPVSPEQYQRMEAMSKYSFAFGMVGAFVGLPVVVLIITGLYWVVFNALLGGTAAFKQVLAVVTHSQVIGALGALVGAPIQLMQGTVTMGGPFNLAALVPFLDESSPVRAMLGSISVFTLWGIIVTAIGLGVLYHRKTRNIAIALLFVYFLITAIFAFGFSAMMGGRSAG